MNSKKSKSSKSRVSHKTDVPAKETRASDDNGGVRLQVLIAAAGLASRRQAERLIEAGQVSVNGRTVRRLGSKADPRSDHIKVDGRLLPRPRAREYFAFNKPVACITSMMDPEGRLSVGDFVRGLGRRVYPVGRLDYHSSGLLLLTNDGQLAQYLTHPRYHVSKTYVAKLNCRPSQRDIGWLRRGVELEDGVTAPARVDIIKGSASKAWVEVTISEGRNQQVRRMFEAVDIVVEKLRRTEIGPLKLGRLAAGDVRRLSDTEVQQLREAAGLKASNRKSEPGRARRFR